MSLVGVHSLKQTKLSGTYDSNNPPPQQLLAEAQKTHATPLST